MGIEPQRSLDNKSEIGVERHEGAAAPDAGRRYSPRKSVSTPRVSSINAQSHGEIPPTERVEGGFQDSYYPLLTRISGLLFPPY
ncbi:hypothetical protein NIES4071_59200 [Calothrix sp. NIES-4071]|nr:hypothetical protein NIES4071_59200 [Calothrix sp. NIES-4071]BAZ60227.1 hypothetical protein NIES4105_59150 [Calothrix sp. NIES-4105]